MITKKKSVTLMEPPGSHAIQLRVIEGGLSKCPGKVTARRYAVQVIESGMLTEMTERLRKICAFADLEMRAKVFGWLNVGSMDIDLRKAGQSGDSACNIKKYKKQRYPSDAEMHLLLAKFHMIFDLGDQEQAAVLKGTIDLLAENITERIKSAGNAP